MRSYILVSFLAAFAEGYDFSKRAYCLGGCSTALNTVTFSTAPKKTVKGGAAVCSNSLLLQSSYLCLELYCSGSFNELLDLLVQPCDAAGIKIPSYAAVKKNYSDIDAVHRFRYGEYKKGDPVKTVVLPNSDLYKRAYRTNAATMDSKAYDRSFGWGLASFWALVLLVGIANRVASWASFRPQPAHDHEAGVSTTKSGVYTRTTAIVKKHLILPAFLGRHHVEPVAGFITVPTRIQGLTIVSYMALNILLTILGHDVWSGNLKNPSVRLQWTRYVADRAGILAISNMPMLWLFGGRNNFLQWVSGWEFSTFNIFHRWIGRIAVVEAIIHGVCYSFYEGAGGIEKYKEWFTEGAWTICGLLAVTAMSFIMGASFYPIRKRAYEIFLRIHIALSVVALAGTYLHVKGKKEYWPYLPFFYATAAVWIFDHLLSWTRLLVLNYREIVRKQKATVSYHVDHDVMRITVPSSMNLKPGPGAYYFLYFPSTWRGYESHPFTLAAWNQAPERELLSSDNSKNSSAEKLPHVNERSIPSETSSLDDIKRTTLTFLVKPKTGFTGTLKRRALASPSSVFQKTVLLEGPYGQQHPLQCYHNVLLLAAGTGITALLPYVQFLLSEAGIGAPRVATKKVHLVWSVKSAGFADDVLATELRHALDREEISVTIFVTGTNINDSVVANQAISMRSGRMDVHKVIEDCVGEANSNTAVACCGPAQVADLARATVIKVMGQKDVDYFEECFGW